MVVVLHNIRSLHNVGSIFRTADAAGVEKIYLGGITPTPEDKFGRLRPQLIKVSLGAEKSVPWEKVSDTSKLLNKLQKEKYKIVAVEQDKNSIPYFKFKAGRSRMALVLGNEISGLPQSILKMADRIVEIPMQGNKESLNVAVAFGIVAFRVAYK
ncbi:RNA methyltransferase [Patescibacteria group bacterium]|nr:RNA methyltransferase [Patescibacteria group bacterium]